MRGKQSGFELSGWGMVVLEESGGFAGLFRGARLVRSELDQSNVALVDGLLERLAREPHAAHRQYPDGQVLKIAVEGGAVSWTMHFDTSELPKAALKLLAMAPLKPLPLP